MTDTTTDVATQDQAPTTAQPEGQPAEAVTTPDSEPTQPTQTEDQPAEPAATAAPSDEEDLADYWTKKGIDISTPEGQLAAAKSYREAEKAMHNKAQQASELEKQINAQPLNVETDNQLVKDALQKTSDLETTMAVRQWKQEKNITPEQDEALGKYVTDNPDKAYLLKNGLLTLDDIHAMSGVGKVDTEALKKQGEQEALQSLATKQRTTAPAGSATTTTPPAKEDPIMAALLAD